MVSLEESPATNMGDSFVSRESSIGVRDAAKADDDGRATTTTRRRRAVDPRRGAGEGRDASVEWRARASFER